MPGDLVTAGFGTLHASLGSPLVLADPLLVRSPSLRISCSG